MYVFRKQVEAGVLSSHGDATRYFVTFLDNHDVKERIRYANPANPDQYDDQVTLGVACLFSLPGIPCLYYGTEQGLHGAGCDPRFARHYGAAPVFRRTVRSISRFHKLRRFVAKIPFCASAASTSGLSPAMDSILVFPLF